VDWLRLLACGDEDSPLKRRDLMQTTPVPPGQISGNVLLYGNPEPLSIELHGDLGFIKTDRPFAYAMSAHAVPLQVTEFGPASLAYPIIFGGEQLAPLAVMSIRPNENLFISDQGEFEMAVYVPAFIRRWPFVLANNDEQQKLIVCIDRSANVLAVGGELPLFENGQPSAFTQQAIQFCTDFETERRRTEQFVQTLRALDLLESKQTTFTPRDLDGTVGQPVQLADYFAVSEEKLAALPPTTIAELHASGALRQIYAHLTSMLNWDRLVAKTAARAPIANA
jgi:hypothetical protein